MNLLLLKRGFCHQLAILPNSEAIQRREPGITLRDIRRSERP